MSSIFNGGSNIFIANGATNGWTFTWGNGGWQGNVMNQPRPSEYRREHELHAPYGFVEQQWHLCVLVLRHKQWPEQHLLQPPDFGQLTRRRGDLNMKLAVSYDDHGNIVTLFDPEKAK